MEFTFEEKNAIIWTITYIAESDGLKNMKEIKKMVDISNRIGFDVENHLKFINNLEYHDIVIVLKKMTIEKKSQVKNFIIELAEADEEINHLEKNWIDTFFIVLQD